MIAIAETCTVGPVLRDPFSIVADKIGELPFYFNETKDLKMLRLEFMDDRMIFHAIKGILLESGDPDLHTNLLAFWSDEKKAQIEEKLKELVFKKKPFIMKTGDDTEGNPITLIKWDLDTG